MSALILFLYSKYYPNINILLNLVSSIDYIHTMCVDNQRVREVVFRSSMLANKKVPCFLVIFPDGRVNQYCDEDMSSFIESLSKNGKQESGKTKTPISNVVQSVPQTNIEIKDEDEDEDEDTQTEAPAMGGTLPMKQPAPVPPMPKRKQENKTDIGSLINFTETNDNTTKKSSSVSRSRSELMNRENVKISKGQGHGTMKTSSLGTDVSTTKSNGMDSNVIEDIADEDEPMLFASSENSGMVKNTHKSKTDIKSIAMEMANSRGGDA